MISSINSDLYSNLKVSSVSSTSTPKTSSSDSDLTTSSQVPKTDIVEISAQAREAMQQSKVAASNTEKTVQTDAAAQQKAGTALAQQESKSDAAVVSSAATATAAATSETTSSTTTSPVLSSLSESEMTKLVSKGTITSGQEKAELARRSALEQQQSNSDDVKKLSITNAQVQGIEQYKLQAQFGVGSTTEGESLLNSVA